MKRALKLLLFALLLISLLSLVALFSAEAGVLAGSIKLPPLLAEHPVMTLAALVVIVGVLLYVLWRLQSSTLEEKQTAEQRDRQRDRKLMLALVQARITKQLADSLQGAMLQALDLRDQPEAVLALTSIPLIQPNAPTKIETSIVHAYEEAEGKLLILGEPGAGKSTLLLQLAHYLLKQAEHEGSVLTMPIIFNLASWSVKRQPLGEWMVEELHKMYQINRKLGQSWVQADEILPLLDGWDEVVEEQRGACVDAINVYRQEHGLVSTVVCSRKAEYWNQPRRFALERAIEVQPLSQQQIDTVLSSAGEQLEGLRQSLATDPSLQALAPIPLMLNLMILAYQGLQAAEIMHPSPLSTRQQQVLADYVQRRLRRRGAGTRYTAEQTLHWLGWLAGKMTQSHLKEFYLERLQPSRLQRMSIQRSVGLVAGLAGGLAFGLAGGLSLGLVFGLGFGLVFGLVFGLIGRIGPDTIVTDWNLYGCCGCSMLFVLLYVLFFGLFFGLRFGWGAGLAGGLGGGLAGFVLHMFYPVSGLDSKLFPLRVPVRHSFLGVVIGWLAFGLFTGLATGLAGGLGAGLFYGLITGLLIDGLMVLEHYALRFFLWRSRCVPWRYMRFLDYAVECILLRKVGGSYTFVHQLLQDYFGSLDTSAGPISN